MRKYAVVYEQTPSGGWSAYVPDLPGCVAASRSRSGIRKLIRSAITFHLEGLESSGVILPAPTTDAGTVTVS